MHLFHVYSCIERYLISVNRFFGLCRSGVMNGRQNVKKLDLFQFCDAKMLSS